MHILFPRILHFIPTWSAWISDLTERHSPNGIFQTPNNGQLGEKWVKKCGEGIDENQMSRLNEGQMLDVAPYRIQYIVTEVAGMKLLD